MRELRSVLSSHVLMVPLLGWTAKTPPGQTPAVIALRTTVEHNRRRKRWNRGFNTASLKGYEPTVQKRALQFIGELEKRSMKNGITSVNLAEWLSFFACVHQLLV